MYHAIVRRRTAAAFEHLSRGDWPAVAKGLAENVHHVFPGDGPLGGERHSREAVALWFERLGRLFPGHEFEVSRVLASGWPSSTWVAVTWTARLQPARGATYLNHGTHWIHLQWGRATSFHAYLDTERVADACRAMAAAGVEEAAAPPIID